MTSLERILRQLRTHADPAAVAGMARYGIRPARPLGVTVSTLRVMAKGIGTDHRLAVRLWKSGIHEARILATLVTDPDEMTEVQIEEWVRQIDSWDLCDQCCANAFAWSPLAERKCLEWSSQEGEYVKRAAFSLMARLAVGNKSAQEKMFIRFLRIISREASDDRNYVRKSVNWALRQIGKRSLSLHRHAVATAREISRINTPSARWIARDALRELTSVQILQRIKARS